MGCVTIGPTEVLVHEISRQCGPCILVVLKYVMFDSMGLLNELSMKYEDGGHTCSSFEEI